MAAEAWTQGFSVKNAKVCLRAKGVNPDSIVEKKELLKLLSDNVADLDEAVSLIKAGSSAVPKKEEPPAQSEEKAAALAAALSRLKILPKQQLTYQAAVIKRDPSYARRQNAALAGATDEQLLACAQEMEERAAAIESNPREAERVEDEAQVDGLLDLIINRPEEFQKGLKTNPMLAAMATDAQLAELRDMCKTNKPWLRWAFLKIAKLRRLYEALDRATNGRAKYIAGAVVLLVIVALCYCFWVIAGWVFRNTVGRIWPSTGDPATPEGVAQATAGEAGHSSGFNEEESSFGGAGSLGSSQSATGVGGSSAGKAHIGVNIAGEEDEFGDFVDPAA